MNTATFSKMFESSNIHPDFSKVAGTWESDGTFIPTE
jgi:hypothetical protein